MSENLYPERGRFLLNWRQVLDNHAILIGQPSFRPPKRWFQFWLWGKKDEPLVMRKPAGPAFEWAHLELPWSEATNHFFVMGATGSGKSLILKLMMARVLRHVLQNPDCRAAIFDPKGELIPWLTALGIKFQVIDPYDQRGVAWSMKDDIRTPAAARQAAAMFVPGSPDGKDSFWVNATRLVLAAVMEALINLRPNHWTLRDVLLTFRSPQRIEQLLARNPSTAHVWSNVRGEAKTESNLMSSFSTFLAPFETVAALWEQADSSFSIRRWATESGGILLLPNHPRYRESLAPIHRLLITLIADETLSLPDSQNRRTFLFLDELRSMGKIDCLYSLANEGRSKGVCLAVGTQSIEGIQEVYGEKLAQEIIGQLRSKIFLRNDSQLSATWVQDHIGQIQYWVRNVSYGSSNTDGKFTHSTNTSYSRRREHLILASEIMSLPTPKPGGFFVLLNDIPCVGGCFFSRYSFEELIGAIPAPLATVPAFQERPPKEQILADWTPKDIKRLKLPSPATPLSVEDLFTEMLSAGESATKPAPLPNSREES
jgi:hypothetical protein